MKKTIVLLVMIFVFAVASVAYAWEGSGSVNKNGSQQFTIINPDAGGTGQPFIITLTETMQNNYVYGGGVQESYSHKLYGIYTYESWIVASIASNMRYYENNSQKAQIDHIGPPPSMIYDPNKSRSWGWSNSSTRVKNYYPGGTDYVSGVVSWFGYSKIGAAIRVIKGSPTLTVRHTYR